MGEVLITCDCGHTNENTLWCQCGRYLLSELQFDGDWLLDGIDFSILRENEGDANLDEDI